MGGVSPFLTFFSRGKERKIGSVVQQGRRQSPPKEEEEESMVMAKKKGKEGCGSSSWVGLDRFPPSLSHNSDDLPRQTREGEKRKENGGGKDGGSSFFFRRGIRP